jgi:hypothetical protein
MAIAAAGAVCASASAQQLSLETFEDDGSILWTLNGNQMILDDGRGIDGPYVVIPLDSYWGVTLGTAEGAITGLTGDLTTHTQGLQVSFDLRNFVFINFFGDPIDPASRPIILELHDDGDPREFGDEVSVWFRGDNMPSMDEGWKSYEYTIPVPDGDEMPAGWGGTGAEDPVTFEPKLPEGRTFRSVLQNVTRVSISTFEPGYFYTFSGIEFGADNVEVRSLSDTVCPCDIDGEGLAVTDIFAFLSLWFAGDEAAEFDGVPGISVPDIFAYLSCWFAGCNS